MTSSISFQERLKRLEAKHGQPAFAGHPKAPERIDASDQSGALTSPKMLILGFAGLVSLVVIGSVLTVLMTVT
ncbi:hypothetical protein [Pseudosulfitobacter sp. DSM 107133]|jgi:hypothetical protein|uniref:hypothetical protein n=1 Tax=Pseudosulfitobacter sp. DSM 107133 TaxID=2883100 RepID=UPI000DF1A77C|nr:hypothetical protein [Pseudosulfitobacter sp. DSM 107133]UOA25344.1 hypothetical protein DSM107133_00016 [Pseudosulfitobacter sp. DSM 107133]